MRRPNTADCHAKQLPGAAAHASTAPGAAFALLMFPVVACRRGNRARLIRRGTYGCCLPNIAVGITVFSQRQRKARREQGRSWADDHHPRGAICGLNPLSSLLWWFMSR